MKAFLIKHRQFLMYMLFGVITTAVSLFFCFLTLQTLGRIFSENGSPKTWVDVTASIIQWTSGVLVAFFTNRRWVFTDHGVQGRRGLCRQLVRFSGARAATLLLEIAVNLGVIFALEHSGYTVFTLPLIPIPMSERTWAKLASCAAVIIGNYILSKLWVFRKETQGPQDS